MDSASNWSYGDAVRRLAAVGLPAARWCMRRRVCVCPSDGSRLYRVAYTAELRRLSGSSWWPVCRPTRISDGYWLLAGWCPVAAAAAADADATTAQDVDVQVYHCGHSTGHGLSPYVVVRSNDDSAIICCFLQIVNAKWEATLQFRCACAYVGFDERSKLWFFDPFTADPVKALHFVILV